MKKREKKARMRSIERQMEQLRPFLPRPTIMKMESQGEWKCFDEVVGGIPES